ncbi:hypothetical protein D6829_00260 [Candidatus Pacearchaeota archaeon]|nr:MAG: hypothetical protein D6829_00260 [Candidatus Pacearchaeota archaeon]
MHDRFGRFLRLPSYEKFAYGFRVVNRKSYGDGEIVVEELVPRFSSKRRIAQKIFHALFGEEADSFSFWSYTPRTFPVKIRGSVREKVKSVFVKRFSEERAFGLLVWDALGYFPRNYLANQRGIYEEGIEGIEFCRLGEEALYNPSILEALVRADFYCRATLLRLDSSDVVLNFSKGFFAVPVGVSGQLDLMTEKFPSFPILGEEGSALARRVLGKKYQEVIDGEKERLVSRIFNSDWFKEIRALADMMPANSIPICQLNLENFYFKNFGSKGVERLNSTAKLSEILELNLENFVDLDNKTKCV